MFRSVLDKIARRFGYVPRRDVDKALHATARLDNYVRRSGHLSTAYHAGRRVREGLADVASELSGAVGLLPPATS